MDLFPTLPQTLSPRLQWMSSHEIDTSITPEDSNGHTWRALKDFDGEQDIPERFRRRYMGRGKTEDEALTALAKSAGIKLWMEEGV